MAHRARFFSVWRGKGSASSVSNGDSMEKYDLQTLQSQRLLSDRNEKKKKYLPRYKIANEENLIFSPQICA